jgi:hypothetical protein
LRHAALIIEREARLKVEKRNIDSWGLPNKPASVEVLRAPGFLNPSDAAGRSAFLTGRAVCRFTPDVPHFTANQKPASNNQFR